MVDQHAVLNYSFILHKSCKVFLPLFEFVGLLASVWAPWHTHSLSSTSGRFSGDIERLLDEAAHLVLQP